MKKSKIVKIVVAVVLVVAVTAGTLVYVAKKTDNRYEAVVMDVSTGSITQTLSTTGTVESHNRGEFEIFDGVIAKEVFVKNGDKVTKGQLLATFEPSSLTTLLTQKQNNYDSAKVTYLNSITSAKDAKAKLPGVRAQVAELDKKVEELTAVVEKNNDGKADSDIQENVPAWVDKLDYKTLAKLSAGSYTEQQLRDFFARVATRGTSQSTLKTLIDSMTTVGSFDITNMLGSSSEEAELMSAKINLIGMKAQQTLLETQSQNLLESTYKSLMDTAQNTLDSAKTSVAMLAKGWYAAGDGIVSEMNIAPGQAYSSGSQQASFDIASALSGLVGSGSADVGSLVSSLMGNTSSKCIGIAVEYYDSFVATFSLGKYDVLDVKLGQKAKITSIGHELEGEVSYISPVASNGSGIDMGSLLGGLTGGATTSGSNSIPAQITILNPDESIIIGIDVDIDINIETVDNAVVVPIESVQSDATGNYIFKLNDDGKTVTRVPVELGLASDTEYQIVSGCEVGEKIVQNQSTTLEDGAKIKIKEVSAENTSSQAK